MRVIGVCACFATFLFSLEVNSWQELGIEQVSKPPSGAMVGSITLREDSILNLTTSSSPELNQQYFNGDLSFEGAKLLTINVNVSGANSEVTPIYWRRGGDSPVINAFICGKMQGNEGACSILMNINSNHTIINRLISVQSGTLTIDQNIKLDFQTQGKVKTLFYTDNNTLEFDGGFIVDLRNQEGEFSHSKITGKRKVVLENNGFMKVNTYKKDFDVQIYGDIVSSGQMFELNLLTKNSVFEGNFDIGDSPHYYAYNNVNLNHEARAKINLSFLGTTSPAPQRFTLDLQGKSNAILNATFDGTQYALLDLSVSDSTLFADFSYPKERGKQDVTRIALNQGGEWITTKGAFADEIYFNVLMPPQPEPVIPDSPPKDDQEDKFELVKAEGGGVVDLRFLDFNQTLRSYERMSEANQIKIHSKLISGENGTFRLYGILNRDLWGKDSKGNSIATDQIITQELKGRHFIQIYWDSKTLDPSLLGQDLLGDRIVVAQQLSTKEEGDFIGASTPLGLFEYATPLIKEELFNDGGEKIGYEWVIGKISEEGTNPPPPPKPSFLARTLNALFSIPYKVFISQTQTLHQRMGDLRYFDSKGGAYVKSNGFVYDSKENVEAIGSLAVGGEITLGGDYGLYTQAGKSFFGGAFNATFFKDYGGGAGSRQYYQGNSDAYGFSAYQTMLFDNGIYTDLLLKYYFANHSYELFSPDFNGNKLDFSSHSLLGSFELGYKFRLPIQTPNFDSSFYYLKPQINLNVGLIFAGEPITLRHNGGYDWSAKFFRSIPVQPSVSLEFGRRFDNEKILGDVFISLGGEYGFNAGNTLEVKTPYNQGKFLQDDIFNLKLGVGGNILLSSKTRFYFEMNSRFLGRIQPVFALNAGVRIPLGGKHKRSPTPFYQEPKQIEIYGER